jgi:WD40 repeat protein
MTVPGLSPTTDRTYRCCCGFSYSPDGTRIAFATGYWSANTLVVLDALSGAEIYKPLDHKYGIDCLAFSPDGLRIVSGVDRTIRVWNAVSGTEAYTIADAHESTIDSLGFSPDRKWIVSGSRDTTICIWDAKSGTQGPRSVEFSPDGTTIGLRTDRFVVDGNMCVKDITTGFTLSRLPATITKIRFSASSQTSITFLTDSELFIMHFPPRMLSHDGKMN